jgi:diguanylate cyclase (GGDEF)-like protein
MDNPAPASERAARQESSPQAPPGWAEAQQSLAAASGLALLLVEGEQPPSLLVTNNNSVCRAFQSSPAHAHRCKPFCGEAFYRAQEAGGPTHYRCHAGLHCIAVPVNVGDEKPLAVIGGRAFLRSSDYRAVAERIQGGDLSELLAHDPFGNVLFALSQDLDELAARVAEAGKASAGTAAGAEGRSLTAAFAAAETVETQGLKAREASTAGTAAAPGAKAKAAEGGGKGAKTTPRANASGAGLDEACQRAVRALAQQHGIESLALLLRADDSFYPACLSGVFEKNPPRISLKPKEIKLLLAATKGDSIPVPAGGRAPSKHEEAVELFPLAVGDEIKGALLVGGELSDEERKALVVSCAGISMSLEVQRLRDELERRMRAASHSRALFEVLNTLPPEEAYTSILRHSAELLRAERGSLLLYDERAGELSVKAALGPRAEVSRDTRVRLGEGVAGAVLREGRPVVVSDVGKLPGLRPAPAERSYKTPSFISYPIVVGGKKVGVLNVTDKAGGGTYDDIDLGLLDLIAPQMALAIDRAEWHQKATQFQLLSITDPLTGLVNRRYLEERLQEELERSKRHRFAMSFMMVDIDDFKAYNDRHGHQAGDLALEMTAQCLKTALRSADVAARYGGEEFSILLPQTGLAEARIIGDRIRRRIERTHFPHGKSQPHGAVTVSIGISTYGPSHDTPASIIYAADQALYLAKNHGKNTVEAFEPASPKPPSEVEPAADDSKD